MKLKDAIEERRSIRKFTDEEIDDETIRKIINSGMLAPSAKNRQPWYFYVVTDEIKNKIGDLLINLKQEKSEEGDYLYSSSVTYTGSAIKDANKLILVFTNEDKNYLISDTLSIGAAIENMLLTITSLNLGGLWIRDITHIEKEINKLVGTNKKLSSGILIGEPLYIPKSRRRNDLDDITIFM